MTTRAREKNSGLTVGEFEMLTTLYCGNKKDTYRSYSCMKIVKILTKK